MYDKQKLYTIIHYILFIKIVFLFFMLFYIIFGIKTFYLKLNFVILKRKRFINLFDVNLFL